MLHYKNRTALATADILRRLKTYQPYKFGGKWYLVIVNDDCYCYRSRIAAFKKSDSVIMFEN